MGRYQSGLLLRWVGKPSGKRGRQQAYSDAAIQACLTIKVLFGLLLRQTTGFVESLLTLAGLDWSVPDFSALCRRQKTLPVAIPYRGSSGPLHLLIDSTGIKAEGEGEWNACKHGGPKRRRWRKLHIGIDEETLEIQAVDVTTSSVGDAPMLPIFSTKFLPMKTSAASPQMAHLTPVSAMMLLQPATLMRSSHRARMQSSEKLARQVPEPVMKLCDLQNI